MENVTTQIRSTSSQLRCYLPLERKRKKGGLPDVTNSTLMSPDTRMRSRNRRIWMRAMNVPVPFCGSSTSTTSPPPAELKSIASPGESGEITGKCRNKCCKRTLFDVNMHARRIEVMVVSLRGWQAPKMASTRESRAAPQPCEDVEGPLRMAQ